MKRKIAFIVVFLAILVSCNNLSKRGQPTHEEMMAKASRCEKNGWIVLHLEGTPEIIGYQHGYLLANEIIDLKDVMKMLFEKSTGKNWTFFRSEATRLFWSKTPDEYQIEINSIAKGVNAKLNKITIDSADIFAMNSILELADYYVPWIESQEKKNLPAQASSDHCSAFAATGSWTVDGKIVIAHNNWSPYVLGERWNIILDIVPDKGYRFVMDALPGYIHSGDDFFINSKGIVVTETTISLFKGYDTSGVAEFVRARQAIQYSSSIDEWVNYMITQNTGGYANDWLIGDNKTGEIARLELGIINHPLERTKEGYFVGANFPVNKKLIREETAFDTSLVNSSPNSRKIRWEELMKKFKGKIDVNTAMELMGDHYDTWRKIEKPSILTLCGHGDLDEKGFPCYGVPPYVPGGAVQGKVTDGSLIAEMKLWAIMGHPCGEAFNAKAFFEKHPEFNFQKDYLHDMPSQKWTLFGKTTK